MCYVNAVSRVDLICRNPTPDGVANGFEYRGGYDFPEPPGTATGRITFETIDRLRPEYAVAWHNRVAPRDRNVAFCTDV